jgi:hypothetical protein
LLKVAFAFFFYIAVECNVLKKLLPLLALMPPCQPSPGRN